jgi:hypothetical protein
MDERVDLEALLGREKLVAAGISASVSATLIVKVKMGL